MRLLYAFFDFSDIHDMRNRRKLHELHGSRGMREIELNFSTTECFSVTKDLNEEGKYTYTLSCSIKPISEQLPTAFWCDQIYNVTAIVGNNAAGKSTLIHSLICSLVSGLKPEIPYLLVLEKTLLGNNSTREKIVYCGKGLLEDRVSFIISDNSRDLFFSGYEYPFELRRTKTVLIDNTLSTSSMEIYYQYSRVRNSVQASNNGISPYDEAQFQFYNRSLFASICHSNAISASGRNTSSVDVAGTIGVHFRYETYQELRVLFDRSHHEILEELKKLDIPVPNPHKVYVTVEGTDSLLRDYFPDISMTWTNVENGKAYFTNRICICILLSIINQMLRFWNKQVSKSKHYSLRNELMTLFRERSNSGFYIKDIVRILELWRDWYERGLFQRSCQKNMEQYLELVGFIHENRQLLDRIFRIQDKRQQQGNKPIWAISYDESTTYELNIDETIREKDFQKCVIDFLEKYRDVSDHIYFLSFSAGLSSGEKNILRMLTQLRYVLMGPESIDSVQFPTKNNKRAYFLQNYFGNNAIETCDTLFLFLDEADLTYHPDWQRQFVYILTKYLPSLYRKYYNNTDDTQGGCKDIQVFLATHSPLLLSNIPIQSCIFLKSEDIKGKDNQDANIRVTKVVKAPIHQTFGANIHDLLNNAFFLRNTVGAYAYKWMTDIIEDLENLEKNKDSADLREKCKPYLEIIELIGDPIIHTKMVGLYRNCFPSEPDSNETDRTITRVKELGENMDAQEKERMIRELEKVIKHLERKKG